MDALHLTKILQHKLISVMSSWHCEYLLSAFSQTLIQITIKYNLKSNSYEKAN